MAEGALGGLRVLELTRSVAGGYCGKLLAGTGAEVIKIEDPGTGDPARRFGPFPNDIPNPEASGLFLHLGTGKKSVTLDLGTPAGADILRRLVAVADILVEDCRPGVLEELGLAYESLAELNPQLVVTSISPFGSTGPYRDFQATELTTLALSGLMYMTGSPDREPLKAFGFLGEYQTGVCSALAAISGVLARGLIKRGQYTEVTSLETLLIPLGASPFEYLNSGINPRRNGTRMPRETKDVASSAGFPCRDGYVHVHSRPFEMLAVLAGEPELDRIDLPQSEFDRLLLPWLMEHDKEEIVSLAQELRLPFTAVLNTAELLQDPQHHERGMFEEVEHPAAGKVVQPGAPFHMSATPWRTLAAPLLGQHNEAIYCGLLGYDRADFVNLRQQGVI